MILARPFQYLCDACDSAMMRYAVDGHPELERVVCLNAGCTNRHIRRYVKVSEVEEVARRDSGMEDDA